MTDIPIYPILTDRLEDTTDQIGGVSLVTFAQGQGLFHDNGPAHIIWPDEAGQIRCVLARVTTPLSRWSCAALASQLPPGQYQLDLSHLPEDHATESVAHELSLGWLLEQYCYDRYKPDSRPLPSLALSPAIAGEVMQDYEAIALTRDLINAPPADMGPEELAAASIQLANAFAASYDIIKGETLQRSFPAIHTVGKGSPRAPRLIDIRFGPESAPKVTLVGKGVCFDSGGLDIKPASGMKLMKKDMGGAACVLGLARRLMAAELPVQLRVLIPAVENSVDGHAFRPSDVITTRSGLSVEVGDTDAEGRLILADALTYACEDDPALVIDCATLTGAARVALGTDLPALFANDDNIADEILSHGPALADRLWQMPLYPPYAEGLKSSVADTSSISNSRYGGAIHAALFLQKFVKPAIPWCHIDMMAWNLSSRAGRPVGGEAMGLRTLFHWLQSRYPGA